MICCPMRSVIFGPARRVMMSMVLPGGKGMTILIGLEGQDCASAGKANPRANAASTNTRSRIILALLVRFQRVVILRAEITSVIHAQGESKNFEGLGLSTGQNRTSGKWPCHSYDAAPPRCYRTWVSWVAATGQKQSFGYTRTLGPITR